MEQLEQLRIPQLAGLVILDRKLVETDGELTPQGWGVLVSIVCTVLCIMMYKWSRPITAAFFPSYRKLSREDQRNWDTRYSSNIHAALCVWFAYEYLWASDMFWKDDPLPTVKRNSKETYMALGVSVGYFLVDMVTCAKYHMGGAEMLLHHIGSLASVLTAMATGEGHMHTIWMLLTEFTTPLINNRWWLDKMDMKSSMLYVVNGVAILFAWVFARLAVFPPFFYVLFKHRDQILLVQPISQFLVLAVPAILFALNLFWFSKIVRGVHKVLFGKKEEKTKEA